MTAITTRRLVVLFSAVVLCAAAAQTVPDAARPQKPPEAASLQKPSPDTREPPVDIARLRKALNAGPGPFGGWVAPVTFAPVQRPPMPAFREEIEVIGFKGPLVLSFAEQLKALEERSRYPYVYAPSLQELSAHSAALQYLHPVNAIGAVKKAVRGALYRHKVGKIHREVEAELQAIKALEAGTAAADSKPPKKR